MTEPDLPFLARQIERVLTELGSLRDEVRVQGAMLLRLDSAVMPAQAAILEELRAIPAQITRMNDRIRKLEDAQP
jgi:hypothetical protein